ncbi:MAG: hypothetical protein R2695_04780 [Acidimicrobiales bacterium]
MTGPVPPRAEMPVAGVVGAVGRFLLTSGVVVLLFVAFQLWGDQPARGPGPGRAPGRAPNG